MMTPKYIESAQAATPSRAFSTASNPASSAFATAICACSPSASISSGVFLILFLVFALGSLGLAPWLGQDFFPSVDSGQFMIHVRAHTGTRIEETAALCDHVEQTIRQQIPSNELVTILDNIGLPYSSLNLSYSISAPVGPSDADIQVQLSRKHHPTEAYVERLRAVLARDYPGVTFYEVPVDIVTQILDFGVAAPIDIQIIGPNLYANRALAERMLNEVRYVPGATDARIQQPFNYPNFTVNVDRTRAENTGLTQQNVAQSLLVALSGSFQTSPNFYLDPRNGVSYNIAIQSPQYRMDNLAELEGLPITSSDHHCRKYATLHQHFNRRARRRAAGQCIVCSNGWRRNVRAGCWQTSTGSGESRHHHTRSRARRNQPLRHPAGHRYLHER